MAAKIGRKLIKFTEEDIKNVEKWAGSGLGERQIATLLGCSLSTITRVKKRSEQFEHALKKGRATAVASVANKLYENAMEGKETSAIFFLKNRDADNWADRIQTEHNLNLSHILAEANTRIIEGTIEQPSNKKEQLLKKESHTTKKRHK